MIIKNFMDSEDYPLKERIVKRKELSYLYDTNRKQFKNRLKRERKAKQRGEV